MELTDFCRECGATVVWLEYIGSWDHENKPSVEHDAKAPLPEGSD